MCIVDVLYLLIYYGLSFTKPLFAALFVNTVADMSISRETVLFVFLQFC